MALAVWRLRPVFKAQEGRPGVPLPGHPPAGGQDSDASACSARGRWATRRCGGRSCTPPGPGGGPGRRGSIASVLIVGTRGGYWTWLYARPAWAGFPRRRRLRPEHRAEGLNSTPILRMLTTSIGVITHPRRRGGGGQRADLRARGRHLDQPRVATPMEGPEIVIPKMVGRRLEGPPWALMGVAFPGPDRGLAAGRSIPIGFAVPDARDSPRSSCSPTALGTFCSLKARSTWRSQATDHRHPDDRLRRVSRSAAARSCSRPAGRT